MEDWIGRAVSIVCDDELGVFQGIIQDITASEITIVRAFRNGVPLRKQNAEVVLQSSDILKINLLPAAGHNAESHTPTVINKPTPVKLPNFSNILGAKQHQQLQKQQQCMQREKQVKGRGNTNNYDIRNGSDIEGASGSTGRNSTLTDTMQQLQLNSNTNGAQSKPSNVQQQQQQLQHSQVTTPNSVAAFFGNMIPPKVEVKMGSAAYSATGSCITGPMEKYFSSSAEGSSSSGVCCETPGESKPIDIIGNDGAHCQQASSSNGQNASIGSRRNGSMNSKNNSYVNGNCNANGKNKQRNRLRRESSMRQQQQQTFGTDADDLPQEDFDFEGNLALFNKQAIWDDIESTHQKPDVVRHSVRAQLKQEKKYRHDENILTSKPLQLRQIESLFDSSKDFVTDDGLIIPTIPAFVRNKIELSADKAGLSLQRQMDILARGASDLAITLLGGARRLTQTNYHQWPKIAIICDGVNDNSLSSNKTINVGAATGRQLASHGLTVSLYVEQAQLLEHKSVELTLFKATDNTVVHAVDSLPTPDLVLLSTNTSHLSEGVKKWLSVNRASVLALDPPPCGIKDVAIKYSILPILPLNGISTATKTSLVATTPSTSTTIATPSEATAMSTSNCGRLFLCNLGIPEKFYRDCGIKYKSPYGHKYVIPIHSKD
ncbi:enhancer of mRNA-decapping protein 3 [Scaptodrosophila lebanonensis]|uniref:Enhancer of mRNA-decapping protein 3 n=1 Tax=Drosophila lebanonensis TaxID=7225 RepID=A0A6J2UFK8_DROLE|nr:enhancer of mRNA-decapping protein 3 [Scaptodrosophila lebanonensis]